MLSPLLQEKLFQSILIICKVFFFYEVKRFDLKGKKYFENNSKYYLCDSSFRFAVNGTRNTDYARIYEI